MREIPEPMAARLAEGVTTFAHVWRVVRRDGQAFAFTDHDQRLPFDALEASPSTGLAGGAIEKGLGLGVDTASVAGSLSSATIDESDLTRGLWDGARVDLYRVDWNDPSLRVHLFAGKIGEVRRGVQSFEAELRGLQAAFNVSMGRVFSRFCDADLGDVRCGKVLTTSAFRSEGVVTEVLSSTGFRADGLESFTDGWFTRGRLEWAAGGEGEIALHRLGSGEAVLETLDPPGAALVLGASFVVYAGCDKRLATCAAKFANTISFRGFPHMPGNDAIQARPIAGQPMDGSSRFT